MKIKKKLFPLTLCAAMLLTILGIMSANISYSKPVSSDTASSNMIIDNVYSENIDVIDNDSSSISYLLNIDNAIKEYVVSFEVINDSDYDLKLDNIVIDNLPDELQDLIIYDIEIANELKANKKDRIVISYKTKDNLTYNEMNTISKYNNIKVNVLLEYNQE